MNFSPGLSKIIEKGYKDAINRYGIPYDTSQHKIRYRLRKWRALIGEARFDLPKELWDFVDWNVPESWHDSTKVYTVKQHDFVIRIPGLLPLAVRYKEGATTKEWLFHSYEITSPLGDIMSSKRQEELAFCLALCHELKSPRRRPVKIEELSLLKLDDEVTKRPLIPDWGDEEEGYGCYGG